MTCYDFVETQQKYFSFNFVGGLNRNASEPQTFDAIFSYIENIQHYVSQDSIATDDQRCRPAEKRKGFNFRKKIKSVVDSEFIIDRFFIWTS